MGLGIANLIHSYIPFFIYIITLIMAILALNKPILGLGWQISLIPFTFSLIKAQEYPFGNQILDIIYLATILGIFKEHGGFFLKEKGIGSNTVRLLIFSYFFALFNSFIIPDVANQFQIDHIAIIKQWKNFIVMPILYFISYHIVLNEDQAKKIFYLILIITFIVAVKFYNTNSWLASREHFSYSVRSGQFGYLGANEFAAFLVNYLAIGLGLFLFYKKPKIKLFLIIFICIGIFDILFSFSRGAYLALAMIFIFFFIIQKKLIKYLSLFIFIIIISGSLINFLPPAVVERITMTETENGQLEHSAAGRLMLWTHILKNVWPINPIIGVGYGIFPFIPNPDDSNRTYLDPHSEYMETLGEQGIIGLIILLLIYFKSFKSGWKLYQKSLLDHEFLASIGIGFCGCVISSFITNLFGDRWTHYQVMTYFWILWGIIDRMNFYLSNQVISKK